ncbi:MAG: branched-chain amino acid ABC transporter permease [Acidobacteria bacterium]|nr:branched-chain amino acid ABC transporter permease [Acidobacteriota bacterium]
MHSLRRFTFYLLATLALLALSLKVEELRVYQGAQIAIYALGIGSIVLLTGYSGQVSLGHGAFMAIGAYSAALTQIHWHLPLALTFIVGTLSAALAGAILGGGAARLSGPYLAGTTIALAVGLPTLANQFTIFNGETGLDYSTTQPTWFGENFTLYKWFFWIVLVTVMTMMFFVSNILGSRYGRTWKALRGNAVAAELAGIKVGRSKISAFTISAGVAGLAGALLGMIGFVGPTGFQLGLSFALVTGAILSGVSSLPWSILGATVLVAMPELASVVAHQLGDTERVTSNLPGLMMSLLLILTVLFTPNGPAEQIRKHKARKQ